MKALRVSDVIVVKEKNSSVVLPARRELVFPHWRIRLKAVFEFLLRPSSLVRLVGPNDRPLERYEFERPEVSLANRIL